MPELILFLKACLVGLAIAAPIGPVALLCIQRSLSYGYKAAFGAALGAALADTILGALGKLGATLSDDLLVTLDNGWLRSAFGLVILLIGIRMFMAKPKVSISKRARLGYLNDFISSFIITVTNPATLLAAIGIFAALGVEKIGPGDYVYIALLLSGIFIGSFIWWFFISGLAATLRDHFSTQWIHKINKGVGVFLVLLGIGVIISAIIFPGYPIQGTP